MINLGDGDDTVVFDPSGGRLGGFDNAVTGGAGFDRSLDRRLSMTASISDGQSILTVTNSTIHFRA